MVVAGVIIYIVSALNLGLKVNGFGSAIVAGVVIGILSNIVRFVFGSLGVTTGGVLAAAGVAIGAV